jgi:hypothetical protein
VPRLVGEHERLDPLEDSVRARDVLDLHGASVETAAP